MKIYVCTDLEGISGVVNFDQTGRDSKGVEYERARHLLTMEVNTVVDACKEGGAKEVVVLDGHSTGYNFIVEELHPQGRYIVGGGRKNVLPGLDKSFDAMILLGYHAMAGTVDGVLDHTQASKAWYNYWVNDVKMGEVGQEAILAGIMDIPIIMVTGDDAVCKEAKCLLPDVETVAVKESYSRTCAKVIPPSASQGMIRKGIMKALQKIKSIKPYKIKFPATIKIEFQTTDIADGYERNGWKRINGTTVSKIIKKLERDFEILY